MGLRQNTASDKKRKILYEYLRSDHAKFEDKGDFIVILFQRHQHFKMFYSKYPTILSDYTKLEKCLILFFILHSIIFVAFIFKSMQYLESEVVYLHLFFYFFLLI